MSDYALVVGNPARVDGSKCGEKLEFKEIDLVVKNVNRLCKEKDGVIKEDNI